MSETPKVSVIVPMYNPENIILRGLRSLRGQTLKDIEIILVNDGSEEETLAAVRKAASEDKRIRILNTEVNSGAGIARNIGIKDACGEYLAFMDADDYIAPDFLELLYRKAKLYQADIAKGTLVNVNKNGTKCLLQTSQNHNSEIREGIKRGKPLYALFRFDHYSAIYNRAWIGENNIRYGSSRYGEDSTFLLRATANSERIVFVDKADYYLVDQPGSLMKCITGNRLHEQLLALREQIDYLLYRFRDNIDLNYEMQRVRWALGVQAAAVRKGIMVEEAVAFLKDIRTEVMRLSNLTRLVLYSPMIGALMEYGENLCSILMWDIERDCVDDALIECIIRCIRFALLHPDRKDLYDAPLQESIERTTAYLLGKGRWQAKGFFFKKKTKFCKRLYCELRRHGYYSFWKKYLKEQIGIKMIRPFRAKGTTKNETNSYKQ